MVLSLSLSSVTLQIDSSSLCFPLGITTFKKVKHGNVQCRLGGKGKLLKRLTSGGNSSPLSSDLTLWFPCTLSSHRCLCGCHLHLSSPAPHCCLPPVTLPPKGGYTRLAPKTMVAWLLHHYTLAPCPFFPYQHNFSSP